jgi:uncharacterized Zn-binding protein involved in type VI secretion
MPPLVVTGATLQCSMGLAPGVFTAIPTGSPVSGSTGLAGTIMDNKPIANIAPFGMCQSLANPTVASATSAAAGALTPMPCMPATVAPWAPGSAKVLVNGKPALHAGCKLMCNWAGVISVTNPGQVSVDVT